MGDGAGSRIGSPLERIATGIRGGTCIDDADVSLSEERHVDSISRRLCVRCSCRRQLPEADVLALLSVAHAPQIRVA
ncbi:hypothetical protein DY023_03110 [Microbacterium bovistercoris]|uniref:Uncharacterized protein n=1 Tax=Microbacterium bovistercoris TaxID=2293570 RepID=A0A371NWW3_9MICO|nr:hypothetical protein DY023_03110 [Microbacterium bovistercoris]